MPWLVAVFVLEKLAYGLAWLHWMSGNGIPLDALFEQQPLSASFMLIYGLNDWAFCVSFLGVLREPPQAGAACLGGKHGHS